MNRKFLTLESLSFISLVILIIVFIIKLNSSNHLLSMLPTWDEATHGVDGVLLTDAIIKINPLQFFKELYYMSYWPPGFPVIQIPAYALFGFDYEVGRWNMRVLAILCLITVFWASRHFNQLSGSLIGLMTIAVIASSGEFLHYSNLIMLEVPSTLFLLLSLGFFMKYLNHSSDRSALKLSFAATTLLFFCKYNYWILWIAALFLFHFSTNRKDSRTILKAAQAYIKSQKWLRGFPLFVTLYLFVTFLALLTGGWEFQAFGQTINLKFNGNALYALALLVLLKTVIFSRQDIKKLSHWFLKLPEIYKLFILYVCLPVLIWFLNPLNFRTFVSFIINESTTQNQALSEKLLFYPRTFMGHYSPDEGLAIVLLGLAFLSLLYLRNFSKSQKLFYLVMGLGIFACVSHPNHDQRYIFPYAIMLVMAAGQGLVGFLSNYKRWLHPVLGLALAIAMLVFPFKTPYEKRLEQALSPMKTEIIADEVCQISQQARNNVVINYHYEFSPSLVKWHCRLDKHKVNIKQIPTTLTRIGVKRSLHNWPSLLESQRVAQFIYIDFDIHDDDFRARNDWKKPLISILEATPFYNSSQKKSIKNTNITVAAYRSKSEMTKR